MKPEETAATVYFDGSCPLCRSEIALYRSQDRAGAICFVDVSQAGAQLGDDLDRSRAMARFHVRESDGRLVSGAAGFVAVWRRLPRWRWAARMASLPGVLPALEACYRIFLVFRPAMTLLFRRVARARTSARGHGTPR